MARDSRNNEPRKKGGLGRGIEALFEDTPTQVVQSVDGTEEVDELNLEDIRPNPYQPRKNFDDKSLKELSDSIKENGVFQPIIVRKSLDGYEIIAGERRFRASKLAKKTTIPAIVRDFDEAQMMEVAVLENLQREDLSPLEEAQAYEMLQKNLGLTQEEVSKRMGKSRPYIANYLRLLTLPKKAKKLLQHGELSMGQARTLLGLKDKDKIDDLAKKVVKEGIPVRKLEALVSAMNEKANKTSKNDKIRKSAFIRASESRLSTKFGSPVSISESKKGKGHLSIDFSSTDDLNRILTMLGIDLDD
ncbi:ParB/RepB/Spo0J family partition protein [Lactobacillus mulieris]|uniref:ParB/RepB/Spo0J family partition protein n=1 Tax=Lactobacillus mulieris TaxID=2508708 RepID=UPI001432EEFA|nr:ParB/RepB/Spo0J family partition protein [Lactobacillus mulieris]MDK6803775.1 ParB/RepB/Spo0J family partition protein [Lactobacillus mulieris]MDK8382949.1 ParB/RepB/Spo0J family partition protein [Lactobacillus mulieris]MDT9621069.1 ParB/RepB/Spo0J family partition protein [Lactobacillus mulieris]NKC42148.1 ParB/RepB/Spo0J family partition protein [Lactobacillus mulieris]